MQKGLELVDWRGEESATIEANTKGAKVLANAIYAVYRILE